VLSQIIRIPTGFIDSVNDPSPGLAATPGGTGTAKFAGQVGMEFELTQQMIRLKTPSVPVGPGKFMYVRVAPGATYPAVGVTLNWDATVSRHLYQVTNAAGTAAGVALTPSVTPGNYTVIQTSALPPTGTITVLPMSVLEDAAAQAEADAIAKAKAEGKTDAEAAEDGRRAAEAVRAKADAMAEAEADAIAKAKADGKTDAEAAEAGRLAAKEVEEKAEPPKSKPASPKPPEPGRSGPLTAKPTPRT
jgi:hypothetical protein